MFSILRLLLVGTILSLSFVWNISSASAQEESQHYQYAVKTVCGLARDRQYVEDGHYSTVVNVHNPAEESAYFRFKFARAEAAHDGAISDFSYGEIGSDGAQLFDCEQIEDLAGPSFNPLIDGFFVVESDHPLDVVAYYSGTDTSGRRLASIDVEQVADRPINPREWQCQPNFTIDLSNPSFWRTGSGANVTTRTHSSWDSNRTWITSDTTASAVAGNYNYVLDFCSCSNRGGRLAGDVKVDNSATGSLTMAGTIVGSSFTAPDQVGGVNAFSSSYTAIPMTPPGFTGTGQGRLQVVVTNGTANSFGGSPTAFAPQGTLTLNWGYAGVCRNAPREEADSGARD